MPPRRHRTLAPETVKLNTSDVRDAIARARTKQAVLVVLQGSESDIGSHVLLDRPITIGRDPTVEMTLQGEGISRKHCRISFNGEHYLLEDLKSTNGTLLNSHRVVETQKLEAGDQIYVGAVVLKFTHADAAEVGYHAQMDTLVGTDDLTGLAAKRRFDAAFQRALESAETTKGRVSAMLDLDGLKQINDTHGHPVGAHTIAEAGKIIGKIINTRGVACRFGGDEFACFLPNLSKSDAKRIAEEIRNAIGNHRFEKDGVVVSPTISIGLSAYPDDGKAFEDLLRKADEALYRAKKAGRNRVTD